MFPMFDETSMPSQWATEMSNDSNKYHREESDSRLLVSECLKCGQAARLLGVTESTIRKWVHEGFIPHIKIGRAVRFDPRDLSRWLETLRKPGRSNRIPEIDLI